jgi:hypothetical protein
MFPGDQLPPLRVRRADEVRPGQVYWGTSMLNARKGWLIEAEGVPIDTPPQPRGDYVSVASRMLRPDQAVLVEDEHLGARLQDTVRLARQRIANDVAHRNFCVVENGIVLDLLAALDELLGEDN